MVLREQLPGGLGSGSFQQSFDQGMGCRPRLCTWVVSGGALSAASCVSSATAVHTATGPTDFLPVG
jgi:hypothetical protein